MLGRAEKEQKSSDLRLGGVRRERLEHFFDVFGEHIEFQVDSVTDFSGAEVGGFARVGDDPGGEVIRANFGDGEADAIDGDGALEDEVAGGLGREGDLEEEIGAAGFQLEDGGGAIDVALDEVAAHAGIGAHGAFEVDPVAGLEGAEVGSGEGFSEQIEGENGRGDVGGGQAAAVDGEAVAEVEARGEAGSAQLQSNTALGGGGDGKDFGGFFNKTGEHGKWGGGSMALGHQGGLGASPLEESR